MQTVQTWTEPDNAAHITMTYSDPIRQVIFVVVNHDRKVVNIIRSNGKSAIDSPNRQWTNSDPSTTHGSTSLLILRIPILYWLVQKHHIQTTTYEIQLKEALYLSCTYLELLDSLHLAY